MAHRDLTSALGLLLSDRALREMRARDAAAAARKLNLRAEDIAAFAALDMAGLEEQAAALLQKRFYEVAQLLPQTCARLGGNAYTRFLEYAEQAWPAGHRRHWLDAVGFGDHLRKARAPELCRSEYNRVAFVTEERRLFVALVRENSALPSLQILYRRKGEPRQVGIKLGP